ncbi:MAG: hypothetical protein M3Q65_01740 [Chloroflexota bacterium]|nr:hypothetical protein [Chloroflexota bacterium]
MATLRGAVQAFWRWYERHYTLNVVIAAGLFLLQLVHLYWLSADVVAQRLTDQSYFPLDGPLRLLILLVDYTEIPALLATTLLYLNEIRRGAVWKGVTYLLLLNSQWLHIFWITDEFVAAELTGGGAALGLPAWLAWVAIGIDYLELPVIYDTVKKGVVALRTRSLDPLRREEPG